MITTEEILTAFDPNWENVWPLYASAFPKNEQQKPELLIERVKNRSEKLLIFKKSEAFIGFAFLLYLPKSDIYLLDYLAIDPLNRNAGYGALVLNKLKEILSGKSILLEVDDPDFGTDTEQKKRRVSFYRKSGAKQIEDFNYILPALNGSTPTYQTLFLLGGNIPIQITSNALKKLVGEVYTINYGLNEKSEHFKEMFASESEYFVLT
jgi:GNAT superfamily N-acetyltransferase